MSTQSLSVLWIPYLMTETVDLVEAVKSNYQILMMDHIPFGLKLVMSWVILPRGKNTLGMLVSYHVKMLNSLHSVL